MHLLLGTRKGLVRYDRTASGWTLASHALPGQPVAYACRDPRTGTVWASLDHGHWGAKLSRSDDLGVTFTPVDPPKYPEDAKVGDADATLEYIWVIQPGPADRPGRIYLGTNPGGLFQSDDDGASWQLVTGLWDHPSRGRWFGGGRPTPGIHSVIVDPRDSRRVLIAISCAGVFESTDEGANWAPRNHGMKAGFLPDPEADVGQDPHYVTLCPSHPDRLWQQNHEGVYTSANGAQSWQRVDATPGGFGFPVVVHPDRPDTAWVVPATSDEVRSAFEQAVAVYRTDDAGATWRRQDAGLPQQGAFDLFYRHALDLSGDTLAIGSTTGNLYVSEDGGERWATLSTTLPPIYSVRFA